MSFGNTNNNNDNDFTGKTGFESNTRAGFGDNDESSDNFNGSTRRGDNIGGGGGGVSAFDSDRPAFGNSDKAPNVLNPSRQHQNTTGISDNNNSAGIGAHGGEQRGQQRGAGVGNTLDEYKSSSGGPTISKPAEHLGGNHTSTQSGNTANTFGNTPTTHGATANTHGATGTTHGRDNYASGRNGDQEFGGAGAGTGTGTGKATFGDKMKGTAETVTGKITKNPELVERGQERKQGDLGRSDNKF